jgi:arylsulfatase A-like enzyme
MPDRPNVLLICTDQQRWDTLGANGAEDVRTPNLDRLAENGVNFSRSFVNAPVCMPSRASYLTGRYPSELRIFGNGVRVPEDVTTIPEYIDRYGYSTANIGKLHFQPHANRDHTQPHPTYGFDHLELSDEPGCYRDDYRAWVKARAPDQLEHLSVGLPPAAERYRDELGIEDGIDHPEPRSSTEPRAFPGDPAYTHTTFVARRTMRYLRAHRDDRFLCVSGFYSPHPP